ncbi:MAG TPA: FHA domain-containing protein [Anaerolineae bacterium]|nr:FHA domain-containing protein [Anaerolineae bacterium]
MPQALVLKSVDGPQPGLVLALDRPSLVLGSAPGCDIQLAGLAPRHATVYWHGGRPCISDLGSPPGTLVNGARLAGTAYLNPGDALVLGPWTFQLQPVAAQPAYTPPPAPP